MGYSNGTLSLDKAQKGEKGDYDIKNQCLSTYW